MTEPSLLNQLYAYTVPRPSFRSLGGRVVRRLDRLIVLDLARNGTASPRAEEAGRVRDAYLAQYTDELRVGSILLSIAIAVLARLVTEWILKWLQDHATAVQQVEGDLAAAVTNLLQQLAVEAAAAADD